MDLNSWQRWNHRIASETRVKWQPRVTSNMKRSQNTLQTWYRTWRSHMCPNAEEIWRNKKTINHQGYVFFNTICATYVFTGSAVFLDFFGLSLTIEFEDSFPNDSWCDSKSHHQAEFCRFDLTAWNKYIWPLNQQTCVATSFEMALHDVYSFQEN